MTTIYGDLTVLRNFVTATVAVQDTDFSNNLNMKWNENDTADRVLNFLVNGADRSVSLTGNLTVELASVLNQDLTTDANVTFAQMTAGNIQASLNAIISTDANGDLALTPNGTGNLILDGLKFPQADGTAGYFLKTDGSAQLSWAAGGDLVGPGASTDEAIARFDGITGKLLQNSAVLIDDSNNVTGVVALTATTVNATTVNATTLDTNIAAAGVTLAGTTLAADGTDADINITITPKGTGEVAMSKVNIDAGAIDGTIIGANAAADGTFTKVDVDNISIDANTIVSSDANGDLNLTPNGTGNLVLDGLKFPQADGTANFVLQTDGSAQLSWVSNSQATYTVYDADANTAWGVAAGGFYTRTITAVTHGKGVSPVVSIMEYDATNLDVAGVDRIRIVQASGNVEIRVPEAPDGRFRAGIFIM